MIVSPERRAGLLLAVEGLALMAVGIGYGVQGRGANGDRTSVLFTAVSAVVAGIVLLGLGHAIDRGRAWARTPAVVLNVFPFPVALTAFQGGAWWVGVPLILLAGTALYLFSTPELRERFRQS